jgi:hypothetical protein
LPGCQILGDGREHRGALDLGALHRGNGPAEGLRQFPDDRFRPAIGAGTAIEVVYRPQSEASETAVRAPRYLGVSWGYIDPGVSIVEHVAGVDDFEVAEATYRAAILRWPAARITLRQGARLIEDNTVSRQSISDSWLGNLRECLAHLV